MMVEPMVVGKDQAVVGMGQAAWVVDRFVVVVDLGASLPLHSQAVDPQMDLECEMALGQEQAGMENQGEVVR